MRALTILTAELAYRTRYNTTLVSLLRPISLNPELVKRFPLGSGDFRQSLLTSSTANMDARDKVPFTTRFDNPGARVASVLGSLLTTHLRKSTG